jgi:hypothetical protein
MPVEPRNPNKPPLALSRQIAGLIGPMLLALALSMLVNRGLVAEIAREIEHDLTLILFSGILLLIAGTAILQVHRTWHGWQGLVTFSGWLAVIGGLVRVILPTQLAKIAASIGASPALPLVSAVLCSALGAFLTFKAFLSKD